MASPIRPACPRGLVRHHFGSKQALREACDSYLLTAIREINDRARADTTLGEVNYVAAAQVAVGPYQRYLARSLSEGSGVMLFDEMVRMTEEWLMIADASRPDPSDVDRTSRATVITAMALSISVLYRHVSRNIGVDLFTPQGHDLLARTMVDIYSHPLLSQQDAAAARAGLDRIQNDLARRRTNASATTTTRARTTYKEGNDG